MNDTLKAGDRVVFVRTGRQGTVVRIEGHMAVVRFDDGVTTSVVDATLKKLESAV